MKKILLSLAIMLIATVNTFAQDLQLVILQHGNDMQAFYGANGFKDAMEAAQTGDVITLSAGAFHSATIDKVVTIQGAGYIDDPANNRYITSFAEDLTIDLPEGATGLYIEGIRTSANIIVEGYVENMNIVRCMAMNNLTVKSESKQLTFLHCRINKLYLTGISYSAFVRNCAITEFYGSGSDSESGKVENCAIGYCDDNVKCFVFTNNIIAWYKGYNQKVISNSPFNSYYYNLYNGYSGGIPAGCINVNNNTYNVWHNTDFCDRYYGNSSTIYLHPLQLTEEGKKFLGSDGTELGIHGGSMPFTDYTSAPQITQKSVAPQADANGKLAVKFVIESKN